MADQPFHDITSFGRGVIRRGDRGDLPKDSLSNGKNVRLDNTGDPTARPGTGVATPPNMPTDCYGPWEYKDATGKTAWIVADSSGGIWEIDDGAAKIAQFPFTGFQTIEATLAREFNRIFFVNGEDRPHWLRWTGAAWEFRESGIVAVPTTPTATEINTDTFTAPGDDRLELSYRGASGAEFVLRSSAVVGSPEIRKRFASGAWSAVVGGPEGAANDGAPIEWHEPAIDGDRRGFAIAHRRYTTSAGAAAPPTGDISRKTYIYDAGAGTFTTDYVFHLGAANNHPENVIWAAGAAAHRPRTWGFNRTFILTMIDLQSQTGNFAQNNGWALLEVAGFDTLALRMSVSQLHYRQVELRGDFLALSPEQFQNCYEQIFASFMTATDTPNQLWVLEQPGAASGGAIAATGAARLVRYDISGGAATRTIVQNDAGFAAPSRRSALVARHGANDGKLYFYEHGTNTIRTYTIASNSWTTTSAGAVRNGPFATSAPETDHVWYFENSQKLKRELLPGAVAPEGSATWRFKVLTRDNVGVRSPLSEPATVIAKRNATVTLAALALGAAGTVAREVYATLGDGESYFFLVDIADNTTLDINVSTDDADRDDTRPAPSELDQKAPPRGVRLVAPYLQGLIYASTSANPNRLFFTKQKEPDNIPEGNETDLGLGIGPIIEMNAIGSRFVMRKESETWIFQDLPSDGAQRLRSPTIGAKHRHGVASTGTADIVVAEDGVYRFDGFDYTPIHTLVDDDFIAELIGADDSYAFQHNRLIFFALDFGKVFVYEPDFSRWLPSDEFPFAIRGVGAVRDEHNIVGGAMSTRGIWAISNDGSVYRLENESADFDLAEWDGAGYTVFGARSIFHRWEVETQNTPFSKGDEINLHNVYIDCQVSG